MHFPAILALVGTVSAAAAATACNANNCLRQVRASNFPTRSTSIDCSAYQTTTSIPYSTTTVTVTDATTGLSTATTPGPVQRTIPSYASSCADDAAYRSACSCNSITSTLIVAPTSTVTATTTVTAAPPACTKIILSAVNGRLANNQVGLFENRAVLVGGGLTFEYRSGLLCTVGSVRDCLYGFQGQVNLGGFSSDSDVNLRATIDASTALLTIAIGGQAASFKTDGSSIFLYAATPGQLDDGYTSFDMMAVYQC